MATGTMKIRVVGDASKFSGAMDKAQGKLGKLGSAAAKFGKFAAAGVAAAGAAAVAGAFKVASFGDEVAKSAKKAGLGAEQFQELRFAFGQGGVEAATFDKAVLKFNKRLGESATTGGTADKSFERLGVSLRDANGNVRDAGGAIDEVLPKLAGIESDAERAAVAGDLFGQRAGPELAAALGDGGEGIDAARQKAQDLGIVMGEEAAAKAEQFADAWDDVKQSAMGLLRGGLTPFMGFMADKMFPFLQAEVIPRLKEFGEWLGPRLEAASKRVVAFFTGTVVPAFAQLSAWWDANGPTITGHAEAVWATLQNLGQVVGQVVSTVTGWFSKFGDSSSTQTKAATGAFERARDIISSAIDAVVGTFKFFVATAEAIWRTWGATIVRFLAETWEAVKRVIDGALNIIQGVFEVFAGLFTGDWGRMWDGVKQILSGAWQVIRGVFDTAFGLIRGALSVFRVAVTSVWSDLFEAAKRTVSSALNAVVGWFSDLPGRLVDTLRAAWGAYQTFWSDKFTAIKNFAGDRVTNVVEFVRDMPKRAKDVLSSKWATLSGTWKRLFDSVKTAAKSRIDDVVSFFKELPGRIVSALGNLGSKIADKFSFKLPGINFSGQGDGPGRDVPSVGGKALKRVQAVLGQFPGARVTSTYRSPSENRRVGGSPTSFHMDRDNPAVDIGGPTAVLDQVAAMLQQMSGWREFLWRTKGHWDHIHVAHKGGMVTDRGIAPLPDELDVRVKRGETILPDGAKLGGDGAAVLTELRRISRKLDQRSGPAVEFSGDMHVADNLDVQHLMRTAEFRVQSGGL